MPTFRQLFAASAALVCSTGITARGFTPAQLNDEERYEAIAAASPSEAQATRDELALASYVHRMGTPGDLRTARYVQAELAKAGWDSKIVTYVVPIAWPTQHRLTLLGAHPHDINLYEPAVAGDWYSQNHAGIAVPYSGYSADRLRAAENAFYQPAAPTWSRSLLYDVHGDTGVLPSLDATLSSQDGDAALATLQNAFKAATAAASSP